MKRKPNRNSRTKKIYNMFLFFKSVGAKMHDGGINGDGKKFDMKMRMRM